MDELRIVGIGGGTGLPVLLRGLVNASHVAVSAIVTVSDNGGSTGRLRETMGVSAVGDLRNCLVALSDAASPLADLLQYRFAGGDLKGHAVGNLILAALQERSGSLARATEITAGMLPSTGRTFAATETPVTLCARFEDGAVIQGEVQIAAARKRIEEVWLSPRQPEPAPGVLEAIREADAVVLAPGSLYTSLMPNFMVAGVAAAIRETSAIKILICNLMTQPGETDGFTASDHLRVVETALGRGVIDFCVVNSGLPAPVPRYREAGSEPVRADCRRIRAMGAVPVEDDLLALPGDRIIHNSARLTQLVLSIVQANSRHKSGTKQQTNHRGYKKYVLPHARQRDQVSSNYSNVCVRSHGAGAGSGDYPNFGG